MQSLGKFVSRVTIAVITVASLITSMALPLHAQEGHPLFANVGSWTIIYTRLESGINSCQVMKQFGDKTKSGEITFILGLGQSKTKTLWSIVFSNPKWKDWLDKKNQVSLWVVTTKPWRANFTVLADKSTMAFSDVNTEFVDSLTEAHSLTIMNEDKQLLTESPLDLKDSGDAIKAAVKCIQQPPISTPSPQSGGR